MILNPVSAECLALISWSIKACFVQRAKMRHGQIKDDIQQSKTLSSSGESKCKSDSQMYPDEAQLDVKQKLVSTLICFLDDAVPLSRTFPRDAKTTVCQQIQSPSLH